MRVHDGRAADAGQGVVAAVVGDASGLSGRQVVVVDLRRAAAVIGVGDPVAAHMRINGVARAVATVTLVPVRVGVDWAWAGPALKKPSVPASKAAVPMSADGELAFMACP